MKMHAPIALACIVAATCAPTFADYSVITTFPDGTGNHLINPGGNPILLDGKIYMTAIDGGTGHHGAVGYYDPATSSFTTLYSFQSADGNLAYSGLLQIGDAFYGTTQSGGATGNGTVWRINTDGTGFQVLHGFTAADGNFTTAGLIAQDSVIYGMTGSGSGKGHGTTIFRLDADGSNFQTLHTFAMANTNFAQLTISGDTLYAPFIDDSSGISSLHTSGSNYQTLYAGSTPRVGGFQTSIVVLGATLYGMSTNAGANGLGMIYSANADGSGATILHDFTGGLGDGANPYDSLIAVGDTLYGMTNLGGSANLGTIFSINRDGSNYTLLHSFTGGPDDGSRPRDGFTLDGNTLYGFTINGGPNNTGTIFSYTIPVPEPATLSLLCLALPLLVRRRAPRS